MSAHARKGAPVLALLLLAGCAEYAPQAGPLLEEVAYRQLYNRCAAANALQKALTAEFARQTASPERPTATATQVDQAVAWGKIATNACSRWGESEVAPLLQVVDLAAREMAQVYEEVTP